MTVWKPVAELPGYSVSSCGLVRGPSGKTLETAIDGFGYVRVSVGARPEPRGKRSVHRLVALAWIPNPKRLLCVNHKNGIKTDNRVENLEWVSHSENQRHAYAIGLRKPGLGKNGNTKLTAQEVADIRVELLAGVSGRQLAKRFRVSPTSISRIKVGRAWKPEPRDALR